MARSSSKTRMILAVVAFAFLFVSSIDLRAQTTYKRGVIVEEFTGTWCGYCPRGAWFIDSLQAYMPDNAIEISWHNNDEMTIPTVESVIEGYFGVQGFPNIGIQRYASGGVGDWGGESDPMYSYVRQLASQKPLVDFRIVNVAYNPGTNQFSADLDVTPFDMTKMPADGIANYVTVGVLTEDGLVYDQHNYGLRGIPDDPIPEFIHQNVARAVSGNVKGNPFTLGTKLANPTLPVRIHYAFTVNGAWKPANLRMKAFVNGVMDTVISGAHYTNPHVYDARQTQYINTYPSTAPDAAWVVLPNSDSKITTPTTSIVWAAGGSVSALKIEYSTNNGSTWNPIAGAASVSASPFVWTHGFTSDMTTMKVRVTDASNGNTYGISQSFVISPVKGNYAITKPAAGEIIAGGTANYQIKYTAQNAGSQQTFSFSPDGGQTWQLINNGTAGTGTFTWPSVPNVATTQAMIKISDDASITATSGMFTITTGSNKGSITNDTLFGLDANHHIDNNRNLVVHWTLGAGNIGTGIDVYFSTNSGIDWQKETPAPLGTDQMSFTFKTPKTGYYPNCTVKVQSSSDPTINAVWSDGNINMFVVGQSSGVYTSGESNGYSISNYPNPFNSQTTIKFTLPVRTYVTINVSDNLGRVVDHLVTKTLDAGEHTIPFNAADLANGVYTYTLEAGGVRLAGKMSIVK